VLTLRIGVPEQRGVVRSGSLLTPIAGTRKVAIVNVDHVVRLTYIKERASAASAWRCSLGRRRATAQDPKGWIPTMVVNMFKKKASSRVLKLQATYRC